jgi:hypothetical protein
VPVTVARMKDLPNDATASTAPVRKAACSAVGTANARLNQRWLDALAADRRAAANTLQTYRDDLAMAALRLTADTQLNRLTARYDPLRTFEERDRHISGMGALFTSWAWVKQDTTLWCLC